LLPVPQGNTHSVHWIVDGHVTEPFKEKIPKTEVGIKLSPSPSPGALPTKLNPVKLPVHTVHG